MSEVLLIVLAYHRREAERLSKAADTQLSRVLGRDKAYGEAAYAHRAAIIHIECLAAGFVVDIERHNDGESGLVGPFLSRREAEQCIATIANEHDRSLATIRPIGGSAENAGAVVSRYNEEPQ